MVRPTKPKEIKPKAEGGGGGSQPEGAKPAPSSGGSSDNGLKLIVVVIASMVVISAITIGATYFTVNSLLTEKFAKLNNINTAAIDGNAEGGDGQSEEVQRGIILDLGEFILNLSDPKIKRYLKVEVALELTKTANDPDLTGAAPSGGGHGGEGKGTDPLKAIEAEMNQFKPAVRDAVINVLSSKTAEELSTVAGKEIAKQQIKEAVDAIFAGEREVLRVSFGTFIIQ